MPLRIGDDAPDFTAATTSGRIRFHEWIAGRWAILFSHPKDFTPVCTTELGLLARRADEFATRNCRLIGLSTDSLPDHRKWVQDIEAIERTPLAFPLIGDTDLTIAKLYDMLPADAAAGPRTAADNATIRSVVVIGPDRKVKATIAYPMTTGRNVDEIIRLLDSLQLTAAAGVATPANWEPDGEVIIPTAVSNEEAQRRYPQGWRTVAPYLRFVRLGIIVLIALAAGCRSALDPGRLRHHEVWLIDQSDSPGRTFGGTLYVYQGADLADPATAQPARVDLATDVAAMCNAATGANPVRPHMLLFNREHTHAVLSFVASGHVAVLDGGTRQPVACFRMSPGATGRQAHAAIPAPDGSFIVVANQNGKLLERIDANFATGTFAHNAAATLDLATCTTPSGAACQDPQLRPDNAPICPIVDEGSRYVYLTLRGGGMFVVDPRTTPMRIVAEYDRATVKGNGCGGAQVGDWMFVNSGGRPGNLGHLDLYGFDVYRLPTSGYPSATPNTPAPRLVYSIGGAHDSHGMTAVARGAYLWVMDRHANTAEVIATRDLRHLGTVSLGGALSADPAPDLVDASPAGDRLYVALRGSTPLSGDPHIATGVSPGLGLIEVEQGGRGGRLAAILPITNIDGQGVERADAHAVRVRRY